MQMRFTEYLIREYTGDNLQEELIYGGINKMLKHLKYWFDGTEATTRERIDALQKQMVAAGGPQKFAIAIRRIPSIRHWMIKHADELEGQLAQTVNLL